MATEYRFDYSKAKPNRFANVNGGWMVEKFVEAEKKVAKAKVPAKKSAAKKPAKATKKKKK